MKEKGRIVNGGMGGFLCPPSHPTYSQHVETDLNRRPEYHGGMSLETAIDCDWLDNATRAVARTILNSWKRPALESPEVQEWILQVLGYFKGCYCRGDGAEPEDWHAANLAINPENRTVDEHAGVHLIRKYYPEFTPSEEHFQQAYWGSK